MEATWDAYLPGCLGFFMNVSRGFSQYDEITLLTSHGSSPIVCSDVVGHYLFLFWGFFPLNNRTVKLFCRTNCISVEREEISLRAHKKQNIIEVSLCNKKISTYLTTFVVILFTLITNKLIYICDYILCCLDSIFLTSVAAQVIFFFCHFWIATHFVLQAIQRTW